MNHSKYVLGFLFNDDLDEVILIEKNRPSFQAGKLNGVGGHVEEQEDIYEAMEREFKEETGVEIHKWLYVGSFGEEEFTVFIFTSKSDLFNQVKTMTDEEIFTFKIKDLYKLDKNSYMNDMLYIISLSQSAIKASKLWKK